MTQAAFESQMSRLAGLKYPPASMQTHWEALRDMPVELLEAAVTKAQDECSEFPSPKMLKIFADAVRGRVLPVPQEQDRSQPLAVPQVIEVPQAGKVLSFTRTWNYYCEQCSDQGMRSFWCGERMIRMVGEVKVDRYPWLDSRDCGRHNDHGGHDWSERCPCFDSNPAVQRRIEKQRQAGRRGGEKE